MFKDEMKVFNSSFCLCFMSYKRVWVYLITVHSWGIPCQLQSESLYHKQSFRSGLHLVEMWPQCDFEPMYLAVIAKVVAKVYAVAGAHYVT